MTITYERAHELVRYVPETGLFYRRMDRGGKRAGSVAGCLSNEGRVLMSMDNKLYLAHRLAWFMTHGVWPEEIDHIDGNPSNNRLENLRSVSRAVNQQNLRKPYRGKVESQYLGVQRSPSNRTKQWRAQLGHQGRNINLGYFYSEEEARQAYLTAKRSLHEGCTL